VLQLTSWASDDLKHLLYIPPGVLLNVSAFIQLAESEPESGGILLGKVRGPHVEIIEATHPTRIDIRSRYSFQRSPLFHRRRAFQQWRSSKGAVRYLGEWHTHPEDHPSPSKVDLKEWRKLAADRIDQRPLVAMIVGRRAIHIELIGGDGSRTLLHNTSV
jgi:integrative and conjugative element protein (TIGR02256 family)